MNELMFFCLLNMGDGTPVSCISFQMRVFLSSFGNLNHPEIGGCYNFVSCRLLGVSCRLRGLSFLQHFDLIPKKKSKELVQHYEKDVAFIRDSSKASREIEVGREKLEVLEGPSRPGK